MFVNFKWTELELKKSLFWTRVEFETKQIFIELSRAQTNSTRLDSFLPQTLTLVTLGIQTSWADMFL